MQGTQQIHPILFNSYLLTPSSLTSNRVMPSKREPSPRPCTQRTPETGGDRARLSQPQCVQDRLEEPETKRPGKQGKEISGRGYSLSRGKEAGRARGVFGATWTKQVPATMGIPASPLEGGIIC